MDKHGTMRQNMHNTPLPEQCHISLTEDTIKGRPIFIVGDVHGCLDELRELLALASSKRKDPFVVFVGDFINKGPRNVDVLR